MKRQYIPENPCVLSFSREKWVSFNTRRPDQKTGRMIEIKHPILFRIVSIYFLPAIQFLWAAASIAFDWVEWKHWDLISTLLELAILAGAFAYFIRGGDLFHWVVAPTSDDGACFDETADTSQCENQSIGRRDA